ncbi:hypothetical protein BU16DRAFT_557980 [Lophium mytilinum]|uniref:Rhodopsin domain-containing protein n=1 Tax=Lophium mytilinum TaxID=390894 RepID=A0A6A6R8A9_9PEZI|nr:hypothetical protein BU16DRAFT_557980 [Lophium mytilinum]
MSNSPELVVPGNAPVSAGRVSETALIASLWAGVAVSFVFLTARICIRLKVWHRLQPDDPFVILAWVLSVANAAIWTHVRKELYFDLALATGQVNAIPADFLERVERLIRGNLAAYILSYVSLWSIKISFIVFFRNFGDKLLNQRITWYAVLGFCVASFMVCIGTIDYRCLTSSGMKMISICMEPRTTTFEFVTLRLTTALDVLTDASIILLSTNVLWRIRLKTWTKLALFGIFSLTLFVIIIAIIRIALAPQHGKLDLSWLVCWSGVELSVALIVVSLASFRILYVSTQQSSRQALFQNYQAGEGSGGSRTKTTVITSEGEWTELGDVRDGGLGRW